jgi:Tol biopolymer transport system component
LWTTRPESPESRALGIADADILALSKFGEMALLLGRHTVGLGERGTLARIALDGTAPREILTDVGDADWSPDGQTLAAVHVVEGRQVLEYPLGTPLYETTGWINHVRVSPDAATVAFVDHPLLGDDRGAICIVPRTGKTKRTLSSGWSSVTGLAWSAATGEIWFTAAELGATAALHGVGLNGAIRTITRSASRLSIQDISPSGRVLMIESRYRLRVGATEPARPAAKERDFSWLDGSVVTDLSADGSTLLINEQAAGSGTPLYAVYARKTDGAPAIRLGDGSQPALSPDGKQVAALILSSPPSVTILPTGVGQARLLERGTLGSLQAVAWFPDGRRLLLAGNEPGHGTRLWTQNLASGPPAPASAEGFQLAPASQPISPDGTHVLAINRDGRVWLLPLDRAGDGQPVDGLDIGDLPIRWTGDGRSFYVFRYGAFPTPIDQFTPATRQRTRAALLSPADLAGVPSLATVQTTPDAKVFAYTYPQTLSDLYLVTGLR